MKISQTLRVAWEGLVVNKVRSFLTTLGVIIGVASVIIMIAVSAGAEAAIAEQINALGANLVVISQARGQGGHQPTLVLDDAYAISEQLVGIEGVSAEQSPPTQTVRAGGTTLEAINVIGTTADFPDVRDFPIADGQIFHHRRERSCRQSGGAGGGDSQGFIRRGEPDRSDDQRRLDQADGGGRDGGEGRGGRCRL